MKTGNWLVLGLALVSLSAPAVTEIMWVKFEVNRTYKDKDVDCFGRSSQGQLFLSAELEDGKVQIAQIQNYVYMWPFSANYAYRPLTAEELKSVGLFQDKRGKWWLTKLLLSESSLRWALYESAKSYAHCAAPQILQTVKPAGFGFEFETEGLQEGIWIAESNRAEVSGVRKDGKPYSGTIQLTQKEFRDGL